MSKDIQSIHWADVGIMTATDREIFDYALKNDYIIITQDLDFSNILALTNSEKPSVILIRAKNSLPKEIGKSIFALINSYSDELETGYPAPNVSLWCLHPFAGKNFFTTETQSLGVRCGVVRFRNLPFRQRYLRKSWEPRKSRKNTK